MKLALLNMSSTPNDEMAKIATALRTYLVDVCAAWERAPIDVAFYPTVQVAPEGWAPLVAFEQPDQPGAEGYHSVDDQGRPYGRAFRACVPGGAVLHDSSGRGESLAGVLSHEAAEMALDILANAYQDGPFIDPATSRSYSQVAVELADPVQELSYTVQVDGKPVDVSNFIWPAWFDAKALGAQVDQMGVLKAPLTLAPGGYVIVRDTKADHQLFARMFGRAPAPRVLKICAERPPSLWREAMKLHHGGRSQRRLAG